jgi:transporter family-2 protein
VAAPVGASTESARDLSGPVLLALLAAAGSGALLALQQRVNGELKLALDDAVLTALFSSVTGLLALALAVVSRPVGRRGLSRVPSVPRWQLLAGVCGAVMVAVAAAAAPVLGVALLTIGLVAGQTSGALVVDRLGLGPGGSLPLSVMRLFGAGLCVVAVSISATSHGAREAQPGLLALVLLVGCLIAVQQALNGRVTRLTGDALVATAVNFLVSVVVLTLVLLAARLVISPPAGSWPDGDRWYLYSGGLMGATLVAVAAAVVHRLGVLRLGLAVTAGQLVGALVLDLAVPVADRGVDPRTVAGVVLTFAAVVLSSYGRRS